MRVLLFLSLSASLVYGKAIPQTPANGPITPDGTCGGANGYVCKNEFFGPCCGSNGFCGSGTICNVITGCQLAYGNCTVATTTTCSSGSSCTTNNLASSSSHFINVYDTAPPYGPASSSTISSGTLSATLSASVSVTETVSSTSGSTTVSGSGSLLVSGSVSMSSASVSESVTETGITSSPTGLGISSSTTGTGSPTISESGSVSAVASTLSGTTISGVGSSTISSASASSFSASSASSSSATTESSISGTASATPTAYYHLKTKVLPNQDWAEDLDGLYMYAFATQPGFNDVVFYAAEDSSQVGWFGLTDTTFHWYEPRNDSADAMTFTLVMDYVETDDWSEITIDLGPGTTGLTLDPDKGLVVSVGFAALVWQGWFICRWWHGALPQLFWLIKPADEIEDLNLLTSCAQILLIPELVLVT